MIQTFLNAILWNFFIFILPAARYTLCKNITLMTFRYKNKIDVRYNKLLINGYSLNRSLVLKITVAITMKGNVVVAYLPPITIQII
jgi:hypothetical protein